MAVNIQVHEHDFYYKTIIHFNNFSLEKQLEISQQEYDVMQKQVGINYTICLELIFVNNCSQLHLLAN